MIGEATAAISALTATVQLLRAGAAAKKDFDIAGATSDMLGRIIEIQTAHMALIQTNGALSDAKRELENEIAELRRQVNRRDQYERTRTAIGSIVYVDKTTVDSPDGPVYACTSCMDNGKISTLQPEYQGSYLTCPTHGRIGATSQPTRGFFTSPTQVRHA